MSCVTVELSCYWCGRPNGRDHCVEYYETLCSDCIEAFELHKQFEVKPWKGEPTCEQKR
jgi:hypothetical protein